MEIDKIHGLFESFSYLDVISSSDQIACKWSNEIRAGGSLV